MKDFLGVDMAVGDDVCFVQVGYRNLMIGTIIKATDKTIIIEHERTNTGSTKSKQFHGQVTKIGGNNEENK